MLAVENVAGFITLVVMVECSETVPDFWLDNFKDAQKNVLRTIGEVWLRKRPTIVKISHLYHTEHFGLC